MITINQTTSIQVLCGNGWLIFKHCELWKILVVEFDFEKSDYLFLKFYIVTFF